MVTGAPPCFPATAPLSPRLTTAASLSRPSNRPKSPIGSLPTTCRACSHRTHFPPSLAPFLFDQPGLPLLAVQLSPHPFNIPSSSSSSPLSPLLSPPLLSPTLFNTSLFSFSLSTVLLSCLSFPFLATNLVLLPSSACGWTLP